MIVKKQNLNWENRQ